jgi:capsular exopolysaccharide synthesis family protein
VSRIDEALRRARGETLRTNDPAQDASDEATDIDLWALPTEAEIAAQSAAIELKVVAPVPATPAVAAREVITSPPPVVAREVVPVAPPPVAPPPAPAPAPVTVARDVTPPAPVAVPREVAPPAPAVAVTPPVVPPAPPVAIPRAAVSTPPPVPVAAVKPTPAPVSQPVRVEPAVPAAAANDVAGIESPKSALVGVAKPMPATLSETLVTMTRRKDAVEQYRKLAATMHHVQANRGVRVVLCTSAVMSEGKTVTAANLALTLSQSYQRRVLLIDADLRRPRLHSLFNVPNTEGLYEALGAERDRKVNVVQVSPYLSLVTAGRPGLDPVHALTSERLARVLEDAGSSFDWVIIDTPPVLVLPDAGLLMGLVDGAVFVVGAGMTTHRMARRATEALGRDRIVGVVMNRAADSTMQDNYGGYYEYAEAAGAAK